MKSFSVQVSHLVGCIMMILERIKLSVPDTVTRKTVPGSHLLGITGRG